ncbi:hypothetical protein LEP1GSC071_2475 [Leptospira santarosai str. JET]|nr:hypothetical protein LEP1GSC071_2475 [Leptospira santarosai str. JET]
MSILLMRPSSKIDFKSAFQNHTRNRFLQSGFTETVRVPTD